MKKIKVALLSGGNSSEREVSLATGQGIYKALDKNKYEVFRYDPKTQLKKFLNDALAKKFEVVFPALHGPFGEDGRLQGMLDILGLPYVFSGTLASALAMDKYKTKQVLKPTKINLAKDIILERTGEYELDKIIKALGWPIVVKPVSAGSSVGVSITKNKQELELGIKKAFKNDREVLLEKFIKGREIDVAVLSGEALPPVEIIPQVDGFYSYNAKYKTGGSKHECPANLPSTITKKIKDFAQLAYKTLGCKSLVRVDFIWSSDDGKLYFLELNTIPGMTATSLAPEEAAAAGISFSELLNRLILEAKGK